MHAAAGHDCRIPPNVSVVMRSGRPSSQVARQSFRGAQRTRLAVALPAFAREPRGLCRADGLSCETACRSYLGLCPFGRVTAQHLTGSARATFSCDKAPSVRAPSDSRRS